MGKYFKAPPSRATRQWLKVELLYCFGERFYLSNSGLSRTCRTLRSAIEHLTELGHSSAEIRDQLDRLKRLRGRPTKAI
ncbi:MAG TPA: hypothetical protein VFG04_08740 [Planctomycetaceae bacterium]|nr:hypothetical protein [Planctomycetaceae bacterium]